MVEAFSVKERIEAPIIGKSVLFTVLTGVALSLGVSYVVSKEINTIISNASNVESRIETNFQFHKFSLNFHKSNISQVEQNISSASAVFVNYRNCLLYTSRCV